MVEHRLAKARAAGSNPVSRSFLLNSVVTPHGDIGLSPSGKAQGFDPCITLVRIQLAQLGSYNPRLDV